MIEDDWSVCRRSGRRRRPLGALHFAPRFPSTRSRIWVPPASTRAKAAAFAASRRIAAGGRTAQDFLNLFVRYPAPLRSTFSERQNPVRSISGRPVGRLGRVLSRRRCRTFGARRHVQPGSFVAPARPPGGPSDRPGAGASASRLGRPPAPGARPAGAGQGGRDESMGLRSAQAHHGAVRGPTGAFPARRRLGGLCSRRSRRLRSAGRPGPERRGRPCNPDRGPQPRGGAWPSVAGDDLQSRPN